MIKETVMRRWLGLSVLLLLVMPAQRSLAEGTGPKDACVEPDATTPTISAAVLTSTQTFTIDQPGGTQPTSAYRMVEIYVDMVDANSSITNLRLTCTGGVAGSSGTYTPKSCTSAGVCTSVGVWDFGTPGSSSWHFPIDLKGVEDATCSWTVTGGAATAVIDTITVRRRLCVQ